MAPTVDFFLPGAAPHCRLLRCAAVCVSVPEKLFASWENRHSYVCNLEKQAKRHGGVWARHGLTRATGTGPQRDVLQVSVTKLSRFIYGKKIDLRCEFEIYHSGKYKVCGRRAHNRLIPFSHGYGH